MFRRNYIMLYMKNPSTSTSYNSLSIISGNKLKLTPRLRSEEKKDAPVAGQY